jgi:cyanate permease
VLYVCLSYTSISSADYSIIQYAPVLFTQAGLSSTEASFLASGVSALLNIAVTIFAFRYAEKCQSCCIFLNQSTL